MAGFTATVGKRCESATKSIMTSGFRGDATDDRRGAVGREQHLLVRYKARPALRHLPALLPYTFEGTSERQMPRCHHRREGGAFLLQSLRLCRRRLFQWQGQWPCAKQSLRCGLRLC